MARYIRTKEVAGFVRKVLKEAFPGIKFSVRSDLYAGGSSINVSWTDGPLMSEVDRHVRLFEGTKFDGMTDSRDSHNTVYEGELVHFGVDYVSTSRKITDELRQKGVAHFTEMLKNDANQYFQTFTGIPNPSEHDYARKYSEYVSKGSITVTRMILENDGQHPAFRH